MTVVDTNSPANSDDALALAFADRHANDLRFVAAWNRWLFHTGTHWQIDETRRAFSLVRKLCREFANSCTDNKGRTRKELASAKTVAAVEKLAACDRRLAATVDQWDANPWLLNTPAGVVDLKTGTMGPHRSEAYATKITAVAPDATCSILRWEKFLNRITGGERPSLYPLTDSRVKFTWAEYIEAVPQGDWELIDFLQRVFGYALTGVTRDHAMFFAYGTGANGKSAFINVLAGILGDYHRTAPIETFTASTQERHPTDLAGLRGARLVTAVETEEGRHWAESKIKAMTGGDKIAARFMRQDFFEFTPTFKLLIAGNQKPGLRSVDEAIRRRFNLIPFTVTIPAEERCDELTELLRDEWPGILAWAIQGCLEWQAAGLNPPAAVRDATASYLESEDAIAAWISDDCERKSGHFEKTMKLYGSWKLYAERAGEASGSLNQFRNALGNKGIHDQHTREGNGFVGLKLKE